METMKQITLTQKDIEKAGIQNSPSGMLIDELAYSAGQWTSEDLYENSFDYEPNEPYAFNYEEDLFAKTQTIVSVIELCKTIDSKTELPASCGVNDTNQKLQAGAYIALNYPTQWAELLEAYTNKLKQDRGEGISEAYNKALQDQLDEWHDDQYNEWLNGDHQNYAGVVYEIAKYFTDARDGEYTPYNHKTNTEAEYTFTLNENDIETIKDDGYKSNQGKKWLLDQIRNKGEARRYKDDKERAERKAKYERVKAYKAEQARLEKEARKAKLLSMTLN